MNRNKTLKTALGYMAAAVFCMIFGVVYEFFSHGVYSLFMLGSFAFPLVLGTLPYLIFWKNGSKRLIPRPAAALPWGFGVTALTVGSIMKGVLDIYGTTNALAAVYWIAGAALLALGAALYALQLHAVKIS